MTKTWLVTGASRGFGLAMTKKILDRGDHVIATVRRKGSLQLKHPNLTILYLDMTDSESIHSAVKIAFNSKLDIVVGNAGYGLFGAAEELEDDDINKQISTNLVGAMALVRSVIPYFRAQGGGRFVQVSSEGGQISYPGFSAYHASKWGIEGFIEAVAQEVNYFKIQMMIVEPGPTKTDFAVSAVQSKVNPIYESTSVGQVRKAFKDISNGNKNGIFESLSDVDKSIETIILAVEQDKMPLRLALGHSTYENIHMALSKRIFDLEQNKKISLLAD